MRYRINALTWIILSVLLFQVACPPAIATDQGYVVHENPEDVTSIYGLSTDGKLQELLQNILFNYGDVTNSIIVSNFDEGWASYDSYNVTHDNYIGLLEHYGMTDSESMYTRLLPYLLASDADLKALVEDAKAFNETYTMYKNAIAEDDRQNETLYSDQLRLYINRINQSWDYLDGNFSAIKVELDDTYVYTGTIEESRQLMVNYTAQITVVKHELEANLVQTKLVLAANDSRVSVGDAVELTAILTTPDGQPVRDAAVHFRVNGRDAGVILTDADGRSQLRYVLPQDSELKTVAYASFEPNTGSLSSSMSAQVVLQVAEEATVVSAHLDSQTVTFGGVTTVTGVLMTENGTGLKSKRVNVYLNYVRFGSAMTNDTGVYRLRMPVTKDSPAGNCTVIAAFEPDRGVYSTSMSQELGLAIVPVNSVLTLEVSGTEVSGGENLTASGRLLSENSVPVKDATVSVTLQNRTLGSAVTDSDGAYRLNVSVPLGISEGLWPLLATFLSGGDALSGDVSDEVPVAFLPLDPKVIMFNGTYVVFAGESIELNGTVNTADGTPVRGQTLIVDLAGQMIGTLDTDEYGHFRLSRGVTQSDTIGFQPLSVTHQKAGLVPYFQTKGGSYLIVPYEKYSILLVSIISLAITLLAFGFLTGLNRKLFSRARKSVPPSSPSPEEAVAAPEEVAVIPVEKEIVPRPVKTPDLDQEIMSIRTFARSGDYEQSIVDIYQLSRKIADSRGLGVHDSVTHREFLGHVAAERPALQGALEPVVDLYESVAFGHRIPAKEDVGTALSGLDEFYAELSNPPESVEK